MYCSLSTIEVPCECMVECGPADIYVAQKIRGKATGKAKENLRVKIRGKYRGNVF